MSRILQAGRLSPFPASTSLLAASALLLGLVRLALPLPLPLALLLPLPLALPDPLCGLTGNWAPIHGQRVSQPPSAF